MPWETPTAAGRKRVGQIQAGRMNDNVVSEEAEQDQWLTYWAIEVHQLAW